MSRLGHLGAFFITGVSAFAVMALLSACTRTQGSVPAGRHLLRWRCTLPPHDRTDYPGDYFARAGIA